MSTRPDEAINLHVTGRRVVGPVQGFGKMWQKTVRVQLHGAEVTPAEVIQTWKAEFQRFWPERNWFSAPLAGIAPGEVALLSLGLPGRMKLSTGVLVLYADQESFTLMTPEGHMLAGWITFSAAARDGVTVAQIQALERTNDPLVRARLRARRQPAQQPLLGADGREPGPPLRGRAAGGVPGRLRRPPPPVGPGRQPAPQRRGPHPRLDHGHAAAPAGPALPRRGTGVG